MGPAIGHHRVLQVHRLLRNPYVIAAGREAGVCAGAVQVLCGASCLLRQLCPARGPKPFPSNQARRRWSASLLPRHMDQGPARPAVLAPLEWARAALGPPPPAGAGLHVKVRFLWPRPPCLGYSSATARQLANRQPASTSASTSFAARKHLLVWPALVVVVAFGFLAITKTQNTTIGSRTA